MSIDQDHYKESGVDISKADRFIERITSLVGSTYTAGVKAGVGGFAALYDLGGGRYLASGTDGVGTKLKLAQELGIHHTIGIDLVAMCANDVLCTGARPLFFLDYLAVGRLDIEVSSKLIEGVVAGCLEAGAALIGGETAEMPGVYGENDYDLAGFCVGEVWQKNLIDGSQVQDGDVIIGLASSGFHSNGYSLLRTLIPLQDKKLLTELLTPTTIYVKLIHELIDSMPGIIRGLAHITGGGFENIKRINTNFSYDITYRPSLSEVAPIFGSVWPYIKHLSDTQLYRTFNMGVGMALVVPSDHVASVQKHILQKGIKCWPIGTTHRNS